MRLLCGEARVPWDRIRNKRVGPDDWLRVVQAGETLHEAPLHIVDSGNVNIVDIRAKARRMKTGRQGLSLIIVDYLQLMTSPMSRRPDNRQQEVAEISRSLKLLAKELHIPVVALSQLNRNPEARADKRPQLSDLRESGSIEQDADVVLFVFREEYYIKNKEPKPGTEEHFKWQTDMDQAHGRAEVIIGKQRHGPTGTVQLAFQADVTRFANLADEHKLPERLD